MGEAIILVTVVVGALAIAEIAIAIARAWKASA